MVKKSNNSCSVADLVLCDDVSVRDFVLSCLPRNGFDGYDLENVFVPPRYRGDWDRMVLDLVVLVGCVRKGLSFVKSFGAVGISARTYYSWRRRYEEELDVVPDGFSSFLIDYFGTLDRVESMVCHAVSGCLLDKVFDGDVASDMVSEDEVSVVNEEGVVNPQDYTNEVDYLLDFKATDEELADDYLIVDDDNVLSYHMDYLKTHDGYEYFTGEHPSSVYERPIELRRNPDTKLIEFRLFDDDRGFVVAGNKILKENIWKYYWYYRH